jgi:hypothetical protein
MLKDSLRPIILAQYPNQVLLDHVNIYSPLPDKTSFRD